jgi:hypothetical protein
MEKELSELPTQQTEDAMTAKSLVIAWKKYVNLFGESPHGTEKQMAALLVFVESEELFDGLKDSADDGPEVGLINFFQTFPDGSHSDFRYKIICDSNS